MIRFSQTQLSSHLQFCCHPVCVWGVGGGGVGVGVCVRTCVCVCVVLFCFIVGSLYNGSRDEFLITLYLKFIFLHLL